MYERDFKGVFIPKEIWLNEDLTASEKMLFAEIDSLDGEEGCYATNEYLATFCGISESLVSKAISKLKKMGYIEQVNFNGRNRVLRVVKSASLPSKDCYADYHKNEKLHYIDNKKENNIKAPEPVHSGSTRRNFRREHEILTDDLASGEVIDTEKKERKKKTNYEKCIEELESRDFSDTEKELLRQHLDWSYHSRDPKRIRDRSSYKNKLNMLEQLKKKGEDISKVIQQSIDREWHAFYEFQQAHREAPHECFADSVIVNTKSREQMLQELERDRERNGVY